MKKVTCFIFALCISMQVQGVTVAFSDGQAHDVNYIISDSVEVENNFWDEATTINLLPNGYINGSLGAYDDSIINISGGEVRWDVSLGQNSTLNFTTGAVRSSVWLSGNLDMSGGQIIKHLYAQDDCNVVLSGGEIGGSLGIRADANVTILGSNFVLDGHSVFGKVTNPLSTGNDGYLTGLYLNGDPFGIDVHMYSGASMTLVPEPATILLFGIGMILMRKP